MEQIGIHEAKTHFSKLIKRLAMGEAFEITNRGKVVGVLNPPVDERAAKMRVVLDEFKKLRGKDIGTFDEVMSWRREGLK